jgi:hypothetical protein
LFPPCVDLKQRIRGIGESHDKVAAIGMYDEFTLNLRLWPARLAVCTGLLQRQFI